MYLDHFGLTQPPFRITPDPGLFFPGGRRGAILDALVYAVVSGEGMIKVVGEVGSGKTMLCRVLEQRLPASVEIVYLANPSLAPHDILHAIAFELHLPVAATTSRLQVMHSLQHYLLERHAANKQTVVFVEEAQGMPLATLEEIRLLSNLETHRYKLLQIVLFGQPELDRQLSDPGIRQLRERITHHFTLAPLNTGEVHEYLHFRLSAVGSRATPIFTPGAMRRIARSSRGLIRRINVLSDKALLAAYADDAPKVGSRHVRAAEGDSEFSRNSRWPIAPLLGGTAMGLFAAISSGWLWQAPPQVPVQHPLVTATPQDLLDVRLSATRAWLGTDPINHYTVQLRTIEGSAIPLRRLLAEASDLGLLENVFVHRSGSRLKPAWEVLYGDYASFEPARAAIIQLPPAWRRHRPFVRGIKNVLREARAAGTIKG